MSTTFKRSILLSFILAGIIAGFFFKDQLNPEGFQLWIEGAGNAAPLLFISVYIISTVLFLPGSLLTLLGGALFGPLWGTLYNLLGATIGAMIAFLISRYLASNWVEKKSAGKLQQLIKGVESEGWRFVAFVRLVPLFPFNLLNYALGITRIKFIHYLIATYVFMLPGAIAYTYFGYIGKEAATGGDGLIQKSLLALALFAVVSFLPRLIAVLRRGPMLDVTTLKQKILEDNILLVDVRSAADFVGEQGHIEEAINIPFAELPSRLNELSEYLEKPVALICRTDRLSTKAAQLLTQKGFADVHIVKQGMTAWIKQGFKIVQ